MVEYKHDAQWGGGSRKRKRHYRWQDDEWTSLQHDDAADVLMIGVPADVLDQGRDGVCSAVGLAR
jgi:hypothetical protein